MGRAGCIVFVREKGLRQPHAGVLTCFRIWARRSSRSCKQRLTPLRTIHDLAVPTKNSVHIEIVAFTESRRVAFLCHANPTFLSARLFPSPRCSASRDSCSPPSDLGPATFEPWA